MKVLFPKVRDRSAVPGLMACELSCSGIPAETMRRQERTGNASRRLATSSSEYYRPPARVF